MLVAAVLMLLLGAFMQIHRGQFAMMSNSGDREAFLRTVMSANDYCVYRLEFDQTWGSAPFSGAVDTEVNPEMTVEELSGLSRISGTIPLLNSSFEVDISNDLSNTSPSSRLVTLNIRSTVNGTQRSIETTLRPAPVYDSGITAGGGISVSASDWTVASRDPYRNLVRARGQIRAPDYDNIHFVSRKNANNDDGSDDGMFWARADINFLRGGLPRSVTDPLVMQGAMASTGGRFIPNSGIDTTVHNLQATQVITPGNNMVLAAGEYRFTDVSVSYQRYQKVSSNPDEYDWVNHTGSVPILGRYVGSTVQEYWYTPSSLSGTVQGISFGSLPGVPHSQPSHTFDMDVGAPVSVTLDTPSTTPRFTVVDDGSLTVDGDFKVTSTGDTPVVTLSGNEGDSQVKALGDVEIEGTVSGNGIIMSQNGNVRMSIASANATANTLGVSVFAGDDIIIDTPVGSGDLIFNGLMFARDSFTFNGHSQNLRVDGAVVARNGDINLTTNGTVDLTYNPDFLEVLLEKLPGDRTKLETLTWKE